MSAFDNLFKESAINRDKQKSTYEVEGIAQTRNGITFIENTFSAKVLYQENLEAKVKKVRYKVEHLKQSCEGLLFQFAENFNNITADLDLQLNDNYEVEAILNHSEIKDKWLAQKKILSDKFRAIPNLDELFANYEKNIAGEEKLRSSIFYAGIAQLFFPRIKQLLQPPIELKKFFRKRNLHGFYFGVLIPVKEELTIIENGKEEIKATIVGSLDVDGIENKDHFLSAFQMLYGTGITMDDITFQSREKYTLNRELVYETGEIDQCFEVCGSHFKKDKISFKPTHHER